ncbi:MAG: hypothetical protein D6725_18390 [Planctomycetota bacterium]|nr:MAG: hypothetical protein D6725_18390 [Planctomycetota bacterium]
MLFLQSLAKIRRVRSVGTSLRPVVTADSMTGKLLDAERRSTVTTGSAEPVDRRGRLPENSIRCSTTTWERFTGGVYWWSVGP